MTVVVGTPASYCSVVGLKPTYGLVSIRGIIPLIVSLDHCGPLTRTVTDAAMMLNVLAGYDRLDIASVEHPAEDYVDRIHECFAGTVTTNRPQKSRSTEPRKTSPQISREVV